MESRKFVEDLYTAMSVFNRKLSVYIQIVMVPVVLCGSLGIIFATFLGLRHGDLPTLIYVFNAVSGPAGMLLLFGQIYEGVCVVRASDEIVAELLATDRPYLQGMTKRKKMAVLKRAEAFRAVSLPIGSFGHFSMHVVQGLWEEILNQILFLFSL